MKTNLYHTLLIIVGAILLALLINAFDRSPDHYVPSSEAEKMKRINYFEAGKSVERTALLEYLDRYESYNVEINLRKLQALEDSIQDVQMKATFGKSLYEE